MTLTCWRAIVAYRCAGAAPVRVGGLGGEAQGAAAPSHVVHVVIGLVHGAGGEARRDTGLVGHGTGHHARGVLHLVCPLTERHHLWDNKRVFTVKGGRH